MPSASSFACNKAICSDGPAATQVAGAVVGRERYAFRQIGRQLRRAEAHRQHLSGRQRLHQRAALRDQTCGVAERHHVGDHGSRKFADAVADHGHRTQSESQRALGERVFERKGRRLRDGGRRQRIGIVREHAFAQIEGQRAFERFGDFVDGSADDIVVDVQRAAHACVLRALAGEQQHGFMHPRTQHAGDTAWRIQVAQGRDGFRHAVRDDRQPLREQFAADAQRVRHVAEVEGRCRLEAVGKLGGHAGQRRRRARGQGQQLRTCDRLRRHGQRRFLEDQVGVGAADAEGTHARAARCAGLTRPCGTLRVDAERRAGEIDGRVLGIEMQ